MKIEMKNVTKIIDKNLILDNLSLCLEGGKIYGISGKNGCGKTMFMRMVAGLIYPTKGEVVINDRILGKDLDFPESIGLLLENPTFLGGYTGLENLELLAMLDDRAAKSDLKELLSEVGLNPSDKRKYSKYSLGMKQRLGIAAAVMGSPDIILLDEPINAIDAQGVEEIKKLVKKLVSKDRIIIVACHDKEELEYLADEIIYMAKGRIINNDEQLM